MGALALGGFGVAPLTGALEYRFELGVQRQFLVRDHVLQGFRVATATLTEVRAVARGVAEMLGEAAPRLAPDTVHRVAGAVAVPRIAFVASRSVIPIQERVGVAPHLAKVAARV